ncbi:MAG: 50S ribosomal protein L18 [Candidatus Pelagibacter sp.]|jgi:large subunit ribosomal protein L18|nr:MAG: 50S ribosomal protein L18 [Pelagibacterales bacterium]|tara:strand:- start:3606 stop:3959 length:354 start_codon:yes stop_codon:yes gene_type:complete
MKLTTTIRKRFRVRNKLKKVAKEGRLRLCITRSSKNISAQIIDDKNSKTLISASSSEKDIKSAKKNKTESSAMVAEKLAKKAKEKNVTKIFFDRGIYKYHGRVKIFAETLRKNGMEF